jgi:peptidyl-tRNA hydrolase
MGLKQFPAVCLAAAAGIGRPNGELDVASYVLQEFKRSEMAAIDQAVEDSLAIIDSCLALGLTKALSGQRA